MSYEEMLDGLNSRREVITNQMKTMNMVFSHDHPGVNVNTTQGYRDLVKELLDLDNEVIEIKEKIGREEKENAGETLLEEE